MATVKELKWLITGADGQLGKTLTKKLDSLGVENFPLNRAKLDVTNQEQIECIFREIKPDVVVNTAAFTDVDGAESAVEEATKINAEAPGFLAKASKSINAKFIQISTDYVFSGIHSEPWAEDSQKLPISVYGATKSKGEDIVLFEYPQLSYIVRTAWLYSEFGNNFVKKMTQKALMDNLEVRIVRDQVGQPTSTIDLVNQIIKMIANDSTAGIYHGTNSGETSWFELTQTIFTMLGQDPARVVPITSKELNQKVRRPSYSALSQHNWEKAGLKEMPKWDIALKEALPSIVSAIQEGE